MYRGIRNQGFLGGARSGCRNHPQWFGAGHHPSSQPPKFADRCPSRFYSGADLRHLGVRLHPRGLGVRARPVICARRGVGSQAPGGFLLLALSKRSGWQAMLTDQQAVWKMPAMQVHSGFFPNVFFAWSRQFGNAEQQHPVRTLSIGQVWCSCLNRTLLTLK